MNQTDVEYSLRQLSATIAANTADDNEILDEACNAEFPKLYTDKITAVWALEVGIIEEWDLGPTYRCCKCDADIVIAYPPEYPEESCTMCMGKIVTNWIPGAGEITIIEPCKQHTNTPCSNAHDLKLSVILGILFLGIVSEL